MRLPFWTAFRGVLLASIAATAGCASVAHTPYPPLHADRSPEALKRGEALFRGSCEACHRAPGAERVTGAPMKDAPAWLGSLHTANLTSDPTAGIGAARDEELARTIRYGVSRDGRLIPMPPSSMGDKDLEAVLGFMRSPDPLFTADPTVAPRTEFSFLGGLGFHLAVHVPHSPPSGMPVVPKGPSVEYGRYMAGVYECAGCHTDSLDPDAAQGPKGLSGGREFIGADGQPIHSTNLTFDATGLAGWSQEDFTRAVREGLAPGPAVVRPPMPRYRFADDVDMKALYEFLRSLPPRHHEVPGAPPPKAPAARGSTAPALEPTVSREPLSAGESVRARAPEQLARLVLTQAAAPVDAAALFSRMGCPLCHAPGARYHDRLARAAGKPEQEVARWIRNPEKFIPGTAMPTYASLIDEPSALALARWIRAGGPSK